MSTIYSRPLVDQLIAANGYYEDDLRVVKVVEYTNNWGTQCYGLIYEGTSLDHYDPSPSIRNPKTLWEAK